MRQKLKDNQISVIIIVLLLLVAIFLTVRLSGERQIIQKRAAGTNEVTVALSPASGDLQLDQTQTLTIQLTKTVARAITISGAEAVITVDDKFTLNSVTCSSAFDGLKFEQINGQQATIMCTTTIGTPPIALTTSDPLAFATIVVSVKPTASTGIALVSFSATRVTEAGIVGEAPDVSTVGESGNYTIATAITATPTSPVTTVTPTPAVATPTILVPTNPLTPTTAPATTCDGMKKQGNYNCQGTVDEADFTLWKQDFGKGISSLSFFEYWRRAMYQ